MLAVGNCRDDGEGRWPSSSSIQLAILLSQGTFGSVVVISGVREKGLLGGGQACFSTSYKAQDGPHLTQQRIIWPKMSVVPRVEKL